MTVTITVPFNLTNGTTADATQVMANFNTILAGLTVQAASAGANTDITSLGGLVTPITPAQGGAIGLAGAVGYTARNNAGTPNTQIDIAWKQALLVNSLNALQYGASGAVTLNFSTVGVANGLDAGSIAASTIYYIYLIGNGSTLASLASLSSTAPTMPAGYTFVARVGNWVTSNTSTLLPLQSRGPLTQATVVSLASLTPNGFLESHVTIGVANNDPVTLAATTFAGIPPTAIGALGSLHAPSTNQISLGAAAGSAAVKFLIVNVTNGTGTIMTVPFNIELTTAQTLFLANASTANQVNITGWVDSVNAN